MTAKCLNDECAIHVLIQFKIHLNSITLNSDEYF